ncbi:MAG: hypothetical protein VX815_11175 [Gemmatimonadota bacterium]|nr:hypothetical protein [Gemmatimonadota bacterium]
MTLTIDDDDRLRPHILTWSLASQGKFVEAREVREAAILRFGLRDFWQQWVTLAYLEADAGDSTAASGAFDRASALELSTVERELIDSLRVALVPGVPPDTVQGADRAPVLW